MSQVFSKQLWKQTVFKVIQVSEILLLLLFLSFEGSLTF